MATSCFLRFQLSTSSSCRSRSCASYAQTKSEFRGTRVPMAACSRQDNSSQCFLPPLGLRPNALVPTKGKVKTAAQTQNNEIATTDQVVRSLDTVQPSLRARMLGLFLGYTVHDKERAAAYAVIETMRRELKNLQDQISLPQSDHGEENALVNLESGISQLSADLSEASELLKSRVVDDEQYKVETLTIELETAKEDLQISEAKIQLMCPELKAAVKDNAIMQKKLAFVQKKLNTAEKDLNVEKTLVASLKDDVQLLGNQFLMEREDRQPLEVSLRETNKSIDSMKQKVFVLTDQLMSHSSRVIDLHDDKARFQKLLTDEAKISSETKKNLEDARNQIMKLGQEREDLEGKANKLELELDSAKGELLSLKECED